MAKTLVQKLYIKNDYKLLTINAPNDFSSYFSEFNLNLEIGDGLRDYNQIHWFVVNKTEFETNLNQVLTYLKPEKILWIYYPKGSSKMQTDLTRDKGWDLLLNHPTSLAFISLISFNDIWSTFGCRLPSDKDLKKASQPIERAIFDYVDPVTKTVKLPDDLAEILHQHPNEFAYFNQLAFTHKKEYIEWIITAKQTATRENRLKSMLEKLQSKMKNPTSKV